jgi:hypothetical protein
MRRRMERGRLPDDVPLHRKAGTWKAFSDRVGLQSLGASVAGGYMPYPASTNTVPV